MVIAAGPAQNSPRFGDLADWSIQGAPGRIAINRCCERLLSLIPSPVAGRMRKLYVVLLVRLVTR